MRRRAVLPLLLALPVAAYAAADGHGGIGVALVGLALFLGLARLGAEVATRLGQPAVLGELLAGVLLGNLDLMGLPWAESLAHDPTLAALAEIGVVLLLFEIGLESTVGQMVRVGRSALLVAVLGVIAPIVLGFGVGQVLLPEESPYMHLFLGAALCATSVGITARVLGDLGRSNTKEARVILGAAVIDDVLGLVVLAAVSGLVNAADRGVPPELGPLAWIVAKAALFLFGAIVLGTLLVPRLLAGAAHLRAPGALLAAGLSFCFLLSWLAAQAGLAPIVGAFAAGLVLESVHYEPFVQRGEKELEELIHPIAGFLAPVFFVVMGMRVDLGTFAQLDVLWLAAALTVAAVLGKQVCMLGVLDPGIARLPVGLGMIPRGEVGLVFANVGLTLTLDGEPIVNPATYTAIVIMVIVTTLLTPPVLTWSLRRVPTDEEADPA